MQGRVAALLAFAALAVSGCGGQGARHAGGAATAPGASVAPVASASPPAPALDVVPLILVHGINGSTAQFDALCDQLGAGRTVLREVYTAEADALPANSLPPDVVVNFGYYRDHVGGPEFDPHASIGSCPVARSDGLDATYTDSYAKRLFRCVECVKRATGASQVDLVLHSMGGIVGRAYTKWLSVDASGHCSVRRIFLVASPSRGINALECTALAVAHIGSDEFMRDGECLELCHESRVWGGRSYIDQLDDDWDGFCARKGIAYAGLSAVGAHGGPSGGTGSVIPSGLPIAQIQQFLTGIQKTGTLASIWPLAATALLDLPHELMEALGPGDGTVRLASSRLDQAPFLASSFWTIYEGAHAGTTNSEQTAQGSTYAAECVRSFLIEGRTPAIAKCDRLDLSQVDAPGHASWIRADVKVSNGDSSPLALQLVEEKLDASGKPIGGASYAAAVTNGEHVYSFAVPAGGGTRRYRAVLYGEHGPIGMRDNVVFTLVDGAVDPSPEARIRARATGNGAHVDLSSNGPASFEVRFDRGPWLPAGVSFDTPPLLPGFHRVEVRARHANNGAGIETESAHVAAVGLVVDAMGNVRVIP